MHRQTSMLGKGIYAIVAVSLLLATEGFAAKSDEGRISELYTHADGRIAIKLDTGFPNAITANECPSGKVWAGNESANSSMKAALITAKASGSPVKVTISGCTNNGTWMKLIDLTVR